MGGGEQRELSRGVEKKKKKAWRKTRRKGGFSEGELPKGDTPMPLDGGPEDSPLDVRIE